MTKREKNFAPAPTRAIPDPRLKKRHYQTLLAIAAHDRLSKNGIGCYASHSRLAELIGCNYSRLSTNLRELEEFGYIEVQPLPFNKRRRSYKVVYTPEDVEVMKNKKNDVDALRKNENGCTDSLPTAIPDPTEIRLNPNGNILGETRKKLSRSLITDTSEDEPSDTGSLIVWRVFSDVERDLKANMTKQESVKLLTTHLHNLETILCQFQGYGDPIRARAIRLYGDVRARLDDFQNIASPI